MFGWGKGTREGLEGRISSLHWEPSREVQGGREQEDAEGAKGCITKGLKGQAKAVFQKASGC